MDDYIGKTMTGFEFNKLSKEYNLVLYKFLFEDLTHNRFLFKEGLNEDIIPFNPSGSCSAGGIYFCDNEHINFWIRFTRHYEYVTKFSNVIIPNDAIVYIEEKKYKSNKIILSEIKNIFDDYNMCKLAVQQNGLALKYVKEQTEELCKLAVQENGEALMYVKEQPEEICKLAVQKNGLALKYVKKQTEEICKIAVRQIGFALKCVKEQTDEICKLAVQQNGEALKYVKEQTEEICKLAVQKNGEAIEYVNEQTEEICKLAVQKTEKH